MSSVHSIIFKAKGGMKSLLISGPSLRLPTGDIYMKILILMITEEEKNSPIINNKNNFLLLGTCCRTAKINPC
jgi:hypothetical protein